MLLAYLAPAVVGVSVRLEAVPVAPVALLLFAAILRRHWAVAGRRPPTVARPRLVGQPPGP